jgi:hypothetical protein
MNRNHAREAPSSRFQIQQVSTITRNVMVADVGCQRCQHCTLHRWWLHRQATTSTSIVEEVPFVNAEEGSSLCKE